MHTTFVFITEAAWTNSIQFGSIGKINETDCRMPMGNAQQFTQNACVCVKYESKYVCGIPEWFSITISILNRK